MLGLWQHPVYTLKLVGVCVLGSGLCPCPLLGWNVLTGISRYTMPRVIATVGGVGRGQTSSLEMLPPDRSWWLSIKGGDGAMSVIFQETYRKLTLRMIESGTVLKVLPLSKPGSGLSAPCCPAFPAGQSRAKQKRLGGDSSPSCGVDGILETA